MDCNISFNMYSSFPTDRFVVPWPFRVFENDECVVELLATSTTDLEGSKAESNYHASLHWYGRDRRRGKLDIRKLIRKQLKKVHNERRGKPDGVDMQLPFA